MASRARLLADLLADLTATRSVTSTRHVDLHASLVLCDVNADRRWVKESQEVLIQVGGRWDRRRKRYEDTAEGTCALRMHRGQEESARWLASWLRRKQSGEHAGADRVWSALFVGGRRSGKSHLAGAAIVLHAVMVPGTLAWAISPTLETGAELDALFVSLMPRAWYTRRELQSGGVLFKLVNGSKISLRSGYKASGIRAGKVSIGLINEGQLVSKKVYDNLRAAVADQAGIVLVAANPPDQPGGRWIEDYFHGVGAGTWEGKAFEFDPRKNPFIEYASLAAMAGETDARTFARDVLGLFTPIGEVVMHAWSATESRRDPPPGLKDVTAIVTKRELGRAAGYLVGQDYQRSPAMAAAVFKLFEDPTDPSEVIAWIVDEVLVEQADEDDLCDALELMPRWQAGGRVDGDCYRGWIEPGDDPAAPSHCAVIADASGWFQDGAHNVGKTSDRRLAERNWRFLYKPQKDSDKNPDILERMKSGNARLESADHRRRMFVANHCTQIATAMRLYENKHGKPNRRSEYAHLIDAVTYVTYRIFGRPKKKHSKLEYRSVGTRMDRAELLGR